MKAYQDQYDRQMKETDEDLTNKFNTENQYQQDEYKRGYDRMQKLEDMLQKEREDRIKSLNDQLAPIEA